MIKLHQMTEGIQETYEKTDRQLAENRLEGPKVAHRHESYIVMTMVVIIINNNKL